MTMYRQVHIHCPRCASQLVAVADPYTRHTCSGCGGVWLDEEDLRRMLEAIAIHPWAPLGPLELDVGPVPCPRCREPMAVERTLGEAPTAEIDVCPEHGAWFDREELPLALQRLQIDRIDRERGPYYNQPVELLPFIWLYQLFRGDRTEPPRRRGRPA
jgi:Zn-finger nucleic acid-binding protein